MYNLKYAVKENEMPNEETVDLLDVHVKTKLPKKTKSKKDMWVFETNKGTLMCFDPSTAARINPSDTVGYNVKAVPPGDGFNSFILKSVEGTTSHEAAAPAQHAAPATPKQYSEPGPAAAAKSYAPTGMNGDLMRDTRISKLSIFAAIAQIQAAKIKVNPDMAAASTMAIICDTMDCTNAVIAELIYPERQPVSTDPTPAAVAAAQSQPVSDEPPFKAPAQPAAQLAAQPVSQPMPPVTPRPAPQQPVQQPYYAPQPAQVATPPVAPTQPTVVMQSPADKAAQAKALFGVKSSLEADMAARVARMLKKS